MGYYLQAMICKSADAGLMTDAFNLAVAVELEQGVSLIPMVEELLDQIYELQISGSVGDFVYLTRHMEHRLLRVMGNRPFVYVEAEYHGGQGGQMAILWQDGKRVKIYSFDQERINEALKFLGVLASDGQDEFQTVGLQKHRHTVDWIDEL